MISAQKLFGGECAFVMGAVEAGQFPCVSVPEIAFAGRSNVGKSSLLNALTSSRIARVSKTPGRTQQINFFSLGNALSLVDLPGYGYAAVSKSTRALWDDLIMSYLLERKQLTRVFLLIDSRHEPMKNDLEIMNMFDQEAIVYQIVLTKTDKIKNLQARVTETEKVIKQHSAAYPHVLATSSEKGYGVFQLQKAIADILA